MSYSNQRRQPRRRSAFSSGLKLRLLLAGGIVLFSLVSFWNKGQTNPVTGKVQRVDMTVKEEIMMGLQSAPQMGTPSRDRQAQAHVSRIGERLVSTLNMALHQRGIENPYRFNFTLLDDRRTVNAFALPGGQIFITEALYQQLLDPNNTNLLIADSPIAGVLGHEIGHVIERHSSARMAQGNLIKGMVSAAGVAGGGYDSSRIASYVGNVINMKYGRSDELESDRWGVELMALSGYQPRAMMTVMDVLERSAGGGGTPEFLSSHPRPANRKVYIEQLIKELEQKVAPEVYNGL